ENTFSPAAWVASPPTPSTHFKFRPPRNRFAVAQKQHFQRKIDRRSITPSARPVPTHSPRPVPLIRRASRHPPAPRNQASLRPAHAPSAPPAAPRPPREPPPARPASRHPPAQRAGPAV